MHSLSKKMYKSLKTILPRVYSHRQLHFWEFDPLKYTPTYIYKIGFQNYY